MRARRECGVAQPVALMADDDDDRTCDIAGAIARSGGADGDGVMREH